MTSDFPTLPSLLNGHALLLKEDSFATACKLASKQEADAGDVFWTHDALRVDLAIVLEPEGAMNTAGQIFPVCVDALGNCLGVLAPPKVAITYDWPGLVRANGSKVATARAAVTTLAPDQTPDRIVVGFSVRLHHDPNEAEPGENPDVTTLGEEGCPELTSTQFIETLCRHLLAAIDGWQNDGFGNYQRMWQLRMNNIGEEAALDLKGETITATPQWRR